MGQTINNGDTGLVARAKINEQVSRFFNVETYGARGDMKTVYDGVMTSGSAVLTSASNRFVVGDVGKVIAVSRAGTSNVPLRTTILSYQSAGQVTLATNAGASVTAQMVDWGTDNTTPIQSAITAAWTVGAAEVFFPYGTTGNYLINGSLVAPYSAQLYIPEVTDALPNSVAKSISLVGEAAITLPNFVGSIQNIGVVIKSIRLGSTGASVLGSAGGGTWDLNYTDVTMKNIVVQVYTNNGSLAPSMTAIDFRNIHTFNFDNVHATIDVSVFASLNPSSAEYAGIILGQVNDTGPNIVKGCTTSGFKYGMVIGEHTQLINCYSAGNYYGFVFTLQNYMIVGHISSIYTVHQVYVPNGQILDLEHVTTKRARLNLTVETEFDVTGRWSDTQTFIQDVGNRGYGEIKCMILHGGVSLGYECLDLISGGLNLQVTPNDGFTTLAANITANTNNYTQTTISAVNKIIFTPNANWDLTGIAGGRMTEGRELTIRNASTSFTLTIKNDVTSTAANRFLMNADFALLPNMSAKFTYDITAARWIKL